MLRDNDFAAFVQSHTLDDLLLKSKPTCVREYLLLHFNQLTDSVGAHDALASGSSTSPGGGAPNIAAQVHASIR